MADASRMSPAELLARAAGKGALRRPEAAETALRPIVGVAALPAASDNDGAAVYRELPLAQLRADPTNPRSKPDEEGLVELAASIREVGIIEPVIVRPSADGPGCFDIIAGFRRFLAAGRAGLATVPVVIRDGGGQGGVRALQLIENLQREDLPPLDVADGIAALMEEEKLDEKAAAARLGWHDRKVRRYLQLHKAPEIIRTALESGLSVEVENEAGEKKNARRRLDFSAALGALKIWKHHAATDDSEGKKVAARRAERAIEKGLALGWTHREFEHEAARLASARAAGVPDGEAPPAALFEEAGNRLVLYRDRLGASAPEERAKLLALLEAICRELRR
jgi:ParB/RepB/Spo0J family partition protein